ncbi:hypothetical protein ACHAWF_001239 [Thalassiosira exigua]
MFLFLGHAVDRTRLCPISDIAAQSATFTTDTLQLTLQEKGRCPRVHCQ